MKIKLDENLGDRRKGIFKKNGFDVQTVYDEGLCSVSDTTLITKCREENRVLVSLDPDFANPLIFKPSLYSGIAVIRLCSKPTPEELYECVLLLAKKMKNTDITGKQRQQLRIRHLHCFRHGNRNGFCGTIKRMYKTLRVVYIYKDHRAGTCVYRLCK